MCKANSRTRCRDVIKWGYDSHLTRVAHSVRDTILSRIAWGPGTVPILESLVWPSRGLSWALGRLGAWLGWGGALSWASKARGAHQGCLVPSVRPPPTADWAAPEPCHASRGQGFIHLQLEPPGAPGAPTNRGQNSPDPSADGGGGPARARREAKLEAGKDAGT